MENSHPPAAIRAQHRAEDLARRLPPLLVAAERIAATVAQGAHGRRRVGTGETFWQFRRYQPGDAHNRIDWRQTGKSTHVFVRENEWEAAQTVWVWRDDSPSMNWRSDRNLPTKRDRADLLSLALSALLLRGGERVHLAGSDVPPSAARSILPRLADWLTGQIYTHDGPGLPPASVRLPRHAQAVLFGDLLSPLDRIEASVARLSGRGVRGHLVQVLDPGEETLPYAGRVRFKGLEGEGSLLVPRVDGVRDAYRERLAAQRDGLAGIARAAGWTLTLHRTDKPPQMALLSLWTALSGEG
ncbi:DUF58 domain-containing protein [Niveispirillum lacus]|uniref:DUF58 domain-containing protein n=1 Tax=Niveispirillum lacus TaxID=1981099 RepID=A0A255Z561_9PROT|nr:DUF58 domain-containing protein [Niveispirillum lacus]OYQ36015.1 DUF58 domain-containing protein [Niveispirillum lacus]